MNILLTGATGFLGSQIVERLLQRGDAIACLVRNTEKLGRLEGLKAKVELIPIQQLETGIAAFKADSVVHTACAYARENNSFQDVLNANLLFPLQVLEEVKKYAKIRWINTDTCLPADVNEYALSKKQFSQWGRFYAEEKNVQFINLQLEHFYGTNAPDSHFLVWVIDKLRKNEELKLTAGMQRRDFIFIGDVLRVYDRVLDCSFSEPYLDIPVGTGEAPSIREIVEYLKECTHSNSRLDFGAVPMRKNEPSSHCDTKKLKGIDAAPLVAWKDGMKQYLL